MFEIEVEMKYRREKFLSEANHERLLKQKPRDQPNRAKQLLHKIMTFAQGVSLQSNKVQQINSVPQVNLGSEQI